MPRFVSSNLSLWIVCSALAHGLLGILLPGMLGALSREAAALPLRRVIVPVQLAPRPAAPVVSATRLPREEEHTRPPRTPHLAPAPASQRLATRPVASPAPPTPTASPRHSPAPEAVPLFSLPALPGTTVPNRLASLPTSSGSSAGAPSPDSNQSLGSTGPLGAPGGQGIAPPLAPATSSLRHASKPTPAVAHATQGFSAPTVGELRPTRQPPQPPTPREAPPSPGRKETSASRAAPDTPDPVELKSFRTLIQRQLEAAKRYPPAAVHTGAQGQVRVSFRIDRQGQVSNLSVVGSSGASALDRAAVTAVEQAAPFLPYPTSVAASSLTLTVSLHFELQ